MQFLFFDSSFINVNYLFIRFWPNGIYKSMALQYAKSIIQQPLTKWNEFYFNVFNFFFCFEVFCDNKAFPYGKFLCCLRKGTKLPFFSVLTLNFITNLNQLLNGFALANDKIELIAVC